MEGRGGLCSQHCREALKPKREGQSKNCMTLGEELETAHKPTAGVQSLRAFEVDRWEIVSVEEELKSFESQQRSTCS